ncbi:redox-regulated ATPase YchF [Candidatus Woesearchaeota archaeon]|nr:redox-regulated ATPase YchF [Candidatus Woesearchaeota archaeon]
MLVGIVGKANCGKSTFFKALTLADVLIANYPFATIDPNKGFAFVKVPCVDVDFKVQCNPRVGYCINHIRFVPVEVMDVAGLVPGAHLGKGLGLSFLDDLRQADAFIHVVDMAGTTNERGEPVSSGSYDPAFDIRFLEVELDMWVLSILHKGWEKFARQVQMTHGNVIDALANQISGLNISAELVKQAVIEAKLDLASPALWTEEQMLALAKWLRKRSKPMIIAANKMDLPTAAANLERVRKEFPDYMIVPCSAESELALKEASKAGLVKYIPGEASFEITGNLSEKQKGALDYIRKNVLEKWGSTGVQKTIDAAVFELLKYIAVFPGGMSKLADQYGRVLPDCFLMPPSITALGFAFKIHSDLGNNFIRAMDVKARKAIGKDVPLKHRDVIEIISGK